MSSNSSPDFSTISENQESKTFNDTIFGTLKKKTLNDYDKELKNLKEENFNLKLRIYMLEEENAELNAKLTETKIQPRHVSSLSKDSQISEENEKVSEELPSSLSDVEATLVNQSFDSLNSKDLKSDYSLDQDRKDEEIETLNQINQELEGKVEWFKRELEQKENQISENNNINKNIQEQLELIKFDLERELYDKFSLQFETELNKKLNDAYQEFYQREQALKNEIKELNDLLEQKDKIIDAIKVFNQKSLIKYNETTIQEVHTLMEELTKKENIIQNIQTSIKSTDERNENLHDEIVQNHIKSINQDFNESHKTHYQFIISDLENQLHLKENLLQKYILIVKDKDYQINQLINVNLLCNTEKSQRKLELFINDLREKLNDKDELHEQFVRNHFDLLKQKDNLIINLRSTQKQLHCDLNKANEILLESENSVEILKNEIQLLQNKNRNLINSFEFESRKNKELIADHQLEMEEKERLIQNLNEKQNNLKERLKKKNEKCQLTYFYEQQLEEKDLMISDLSEKNAQLIKRLETKCEVLDKDSDEKLNLLTSENNQLKNSLSKANLKLEQLEEDHIFRVDELEIEIENLSKKLKQKENTIQNLVISAEEKDNLISKLKSNLLNENKPKDSTSSDISNQNSFEELLAKIQEKEKQIEELKTEIDNLKGKHISISELSQSTLANSKLSNSLSNSFSTDNNFKYILDLLEKELNIYKNLNTNKNKEASNILTEIFSLRNQLLKLTVLKENRALSAKSRFLSSDNLNIYPNMNEKNSVTTLFSPENTSIQDSGMNSHKSDTTIDSNISQSQLVKSSSSPKLSNSTTALNSSKITEFTLKNFSREELIAHIQQVNSENSILKRQLDNKGPKVTEIHKENSNLRKKIESAEKINDYLRKQLELHHITNGNAESLFEMAQKLNLTKEELEQYKQKLMNSKKEQNSSRSNVSNLANSLSSKLTEVYSNHDHSQNLPTKNIKVSIITLEKELENLQIKYQKLKDLYNNSERRARYLAIKFNQYTPYLNDLGLVKVNNLKRCFSDPNLKNSQDKQNVSDHQLEKLVRHMLNENLGNNSEIPKTENEKTKTYDVTNELKNLSLKIKLDQQDATIKQYYEALSNIFNGFRSLKAQSKYLKELFGEVLFQKLLTDFSEKKLSDNLVHKIFSSAFTKFEELCNELEEKRSLIEKLEIELEELKSDRDLNGSPSQLTNSSETKQTFNFEVLELNQKLKNYKEENKKLREKIRSQNFEIEEAIQQLILYNKEKENTKLLLNEKNGNGTERKSSQPKLNFLISDKLNNTHSKLRKARNNIQFKIENNQKVCE